MQNFTFTLKGTSSTRATSEKSQIWDFSFAVHSQVESFFEKCLKILSSKQYYLKHISKCDGITNSLECKYCHKILSNSYSKYRHLKTCKVKCKLLEEN